MMRDLVSGRLGVAIAAVVVTGAVGAVSVAIGAIGSSKPLVACVRAKDGVLHVPKHGKRCTKSEPTITISATSVVSGPAGAAGPTGAAGAPGEPGLTGVKGDTGTKGDLGMKGDTGPEGQQSTAPPTPYTIPVDNSLVMSVDGAAAVPVASLAGCDRPDFSAPARDCVVYFAGIWQPVTELMSAAVTGQHQQHAVKLLQLNGSNQIVSGVELHEAEVSDVTLDELDATGSAQIGETLTLHPAAMTEVTSNATQTVAVGGKSQLTSDFRVTLEGATLTALTKVQGVEVRVPAKEGAPVIGTITLTSVNQAATIGRLQTWSEERSDQALVIQLLNSSLTTAQLQFAIPAAHPEGALEPFSPRQIRVTGSSALIE
jgi:Collagen triple helix repeat (20 copies)